MKLAIFDIDGTLVRGSSERMFWRYLLMRGRQGPRQILAYLLFLVRYLPTGGIVTVKKNKAYLCGLRADEIAALAREFVQTRLRKRLFAPAVQRLEQHRRRGDTVVLMSGTLEPIARALADELHVRHVCATLCSERHGVYLAQPPETHPYGAAKLSLARQLAQQIDADLGHAHGGIGGNDQIVEDHRGYIRAWPNDPQGTRITIELPAHRDAGVQILAKSAVH